MWEAGFAPAEAHPAAAAAMHTVAIMRNFVKRTPAARSTPPP
jgi:hypothetical protein